MSHVIAPRFIGPALDDGGYQVGYSCRFNPLDSTRLDRTFGSGGSRKKWTLNAWVKRSGLDTGEVLFSCLSATNDTDAASIQFGANNCFYVVGWTTDYRISNRVFRDPSAWGMLTVVVDTAQSSGTDRIKAWWNGEAMTWATTNDPSLNGDLGINQAISHRIGANTGSGGTASSYVNGYLSQVCFINDAALDPTNFGEVDANGVWRPIDVTGLTFGTNGFLLDFAHNTTANDLGLDAVGNNDFTSSGLTTADQMTDTPTDNFATWNPLIQPSAATEVRAALTDGNLMTIDAGASLAYAMGSVAIGTHGKFYWEARPTVGDTTYIGLAKTDFTTFLVGNNALIWAYTSIGFTYGNGTTSAYGATYTSGDVIGVAYDADNNTLEFFKNNVSQGTAFSSGMNSQPVVPFWGAATGGTNTCEINFGQRPFTYVPPSGFVALNTANLPEPASAGSVTPVTGSFSGNGSTDGPFVWLGYTPDTTTTSTINSNTITWGTHARPTAGGFKVITSSSSYNNNGVSNSYSIAVAHPFGGEDTTPMTAR